MFVDWAINGWFYPDTIGDWWSTFLNFLGADGPLIPFQSLRGGGCGTIGVVQKQVVYGMVYLDEKFDDAT